jgi:glycogen operon protein
VRDFILDCLRYWTIEMDVDGFRFDLASILGRDQEGNILATLP